MLFSQVTSAQLDLDLNSFLPFLNMSPSISNTMRRFSRGSSVRNSQNSATSTSAPQPLGPNTQTSGSGGYTPPLTGHSAPNGGIATNATNTAPGGAPGYHGAGIGGGDSRPISAASNSSFDFMNRPVSHQQPHQMPTSTMSGLSRTDQVVLRYFWEDKYADNAKRDLHFVSFHFHSTSGNRRGESHATSAC